MTAVDRGAYLTAPIVRAGVVAAFRKLDPRVQFRNPVMFVVWVGSVLTTAIGLAAVAGLADDAGDPGFVLAIAGWLWATVLFANFAEAVAEGRGKAQAAALRSTRRDVQAKRLVSGRRADGFRTVAANELRRGDTFLVEAKDTIPADGEVVEGVASVDESAVTGESAPVLREAGGDFSSVTGGTRVLSDWLVVRATSEPGRSFLDRMIAMVEGAKRGRTPNEIALSILLAKLTLIFLLATVTLAPFSAWAVADAGAGTVRRLDEIPPRFDAAGHVVEQFEATSKDGTRVPYFVVKPKDLETDGAAPTLLYGYGGFEVSMTPAYSGTLGRLWLESGGVYVLANIRGGGEFGPAWHQAGLKTKRQVIFDDFHAVAEDLVKRGITSPRRLGIMGGSNGGLLMGVALTQRPDLWNALVIQVPLLDMLRYHRLLAGASWMDEYGNPDVPAERAFLERISPYHNLRRGVAYPPPFFVTSTKDDRVHPGHARKYVARMIELGMPVLYYENIDGGHSAAANLNEAARRRALEYTYLMQQLMD